LRDPQSGVSVGFIQGGTTTRKESPGIESLGTVFYEPLWFFSRISGSRAEGLSGRRLSVGPEGSGTRALVLKLLERNKIVAELFGLTPEVAREKLIAGDIDVVFIVASWDAPEVQRLITAEGIELRSFPRADAYIGLYPFLNKLVLPEGIGDPAMNRPPSDVALVAPKASLAVRADLHPAIQYLLLDAAVQVHSGPGIFQKAGQFPAAESIDIPLSAEAQRFYKSGRPFLQDYLPFWIAALTAACCARATSGQAVADITIPVMRSRRRIAFIRPRTTTYVAFNSGHQNTNFRPGKREAIVNLHCRNSEPPMSLTGHGQPKNCIRV
jgi:hypothetical protein